MQSVKQLLMYGSLFALVSATACSSLEANVAYEDSASAASEVQATPEQRQRDEVLLQRMSNDSQAGGE
jgi:hypothetical protein